uniref:Odorant binding protein n=1 Tax=Calliphora stygia TaxID=145453 RepID=A0A068F5R7_CALSG|nr:odorant binding protein [Calliphora stygia]
MKVFVAILALVACVSAEEWTVKTDDQIKEISTECLKEHPLSAEQINKIKNFVYPDEEEVRQYLLCAVVKSGVFCTHEGYDAGRVAKQIKMDLDEEEVKKAVEDCIAKFPKGDKANDVVVLETHTCLMSSTTGEKLKELLKKRRETAEKHE